MLIGAFPHALLDDEQSQRQLRAACMRMLSLAVAFCAALAAVFLLLAQPDLALLLAIAMVSLGCCWIISERFCLSTGVVLAQVLCLAVTTWFCLAFDLPSEDVPRTSHGYFLVIALVGYIDFRRAPRPVAVAVICAAACAFVVFSSMRLQLGFARPISEPIRAVLAWINPLATVVLLAACLYVVQRRATTNTRMVRDLAGAVSRGELELLLLPHVDRSRRVIGAGAVLRWNHPEGALPASAFMPAAAEADLAPQIEAWALSEAVMTLSRWQLRSHTYDLILTAALSAESLRSHGLVDSLADRLRTHGAHGRHLRVELDARDAITELETILEPLRQLRALGVTLTLGGFGSITSTLGDLERLPIQHIALDAELTRVAGESARSATMARGIVHLAQALDLHVLSSGIEREAQFDFMRECGCDAFEGPLFGGPMRPRDFDSHVQARSVELTWMEDATN